MNPERHPSLEMLTPEQYRKRYLDIVSSRRVHEPGPAATADLEPGSLPELLEPCDIFRPEMVRSAMRKKKGPGRWKGQRLGYEWWRGGDREINSREGS